MLGLVRKIAAASVIWTMGLPGLADEPLPAPEGPAILAVSGAVPAANATAGAIFDLALLADIGTESFRTETIWTEGKQTFTGTPLKAVLDRLGVTGGMLRAIALNDYHADIPYASINDDAPLLVWQVNGAPLTVRNRGPIWIVYPYDSHRDYQTDEIYARSVWQLDRIVVRDIP